MKKIHTFDAVYDAQKMYRLLLTAFSQPGKILNLQAYSEKLCGNDPSLLALGMTLLDNEVTFSTCGNDALADELVSLTLAGRASPEDADFIFVTDADKLPAAVAGAKCGTLRDPHKSATLVVRTGDRQDTTLRIAGPGIKDVTTLQTSKTALEALKHRGAQCYEYPQGIDLIFISDSGDMFALPRLVRLEG